MDRVSGQQRAAITKASDARLRAMLVQAGFQSKDLEVLERPRLIEMMAALTAEESAIVVGAEAAISAESDGEEMKDVSDTERAAAVGMSLEERQLILREREMEERRQARLLEEKKLEQERILQERKLEHKRMQKEQDNVLKERELQLKE